MNKSENKIALKFVSDAKQYTSLNNILEFKMTMIL